MSQPKWKKSPPGTPVEQRFWNMVDQSGGADACWPFRGAPVGPKGHRKLTVNGKGVLAHRLSWEIHCGKPGKTCVLHKCDNPPCVNPRHLFLGTRAVNNADMDAKGRRKPHIGEANPRSHLTANQVRDIRRIRQSDGTSYPKLATQFGVAAGTIQAILEGRTWKSVK